MGVLSRSDVGSQALRDGHHASFLAGGRQRLDGPARLLNDAAVAHVRLQGNAEQMKGVEAESDLPVGSGVDEKVAERPAGGVGGRRLLVMAHHDGSEVVDDPGVSHRSLRLGVVSGEVREGPAADLLQLRVTPMGPQNRSDVLWESEA